MNDSNHRVELPEGAEKYRLPDVPLPDDLEHDERDERNIPRDDEYGDMLVDERPDDDEEEMINKYLGMELIMDVGTSNERGTRVVKRARTDDGKAIGAAHSNPILDTRSYEIEFTDGTRDKVTANIIAENMYAQIDDQGNSFLLLDEIQDHRKDGLLLQIKMLMLIEATTNTGSQLQKAGNY